MCACMWDVMAKYGKNHHSNHAILAGYIEFLPRVRCSRRAMRAKTLERYHIHEAMITEICGTHCKYF